MSYLVEWLKLNEKDQNKLNLSTNEYESHFAGKMRGNHRLYNPKNPDNQRINGV